MAIREIWRDSLWCVKDRDDLQQLIEKLIEILKELTIDVEGLQKELQEEETNITNLKRQVGAACERV